MSDAGEGLVGPASSEGAQQPLVGVVMGSDSDWTVMSDAAQVLRDFGIPHEVDVVSAHRMPQDMVEYGLVAAERGLKVIIAGAGGAAHLPGMLASVTSLPVIGGDAAAACIAAASVLAKVSRDATMVALDTQLPGYGFAGHKGYGTALHTAALNALGPSPEHRMSYANVRAAVGAMYTAAVGAR